MLHICVHAFTISLRASVLYGSHIPIISVASFRIKKFIVMGLGCAKFFLSTCRINHILNSILDRGCSPGGMRVYVVTRCNIPHSMRMQCTYMKCTFTHFVTRSALYAFTISLTWNALTRSGFHTCCNALARSACTYMRGKTRMQCTLCVNQLVPSELAQFPVS